MALAEDKPIALDHLPDVVGASLSGSPRPSEQQPLSDDDMEQRSLLVESLQRHNGNIAAVARDFGKARQQIHRWLKRYQLDVAKFRES